MGRKIKLCDSECSLMISDVQVCGVGGHLAPWPRSGQMDDSRKARSAAAPPFKVAEL